MRKVFFALIICQTIMIFLFPSVAKSQEGSLYKRHWVCCLCQKQFKVENLTPQKRQHMGRKADTMCPDCEQKLGGDLDKAYEQRKQRNAQLMARYRVRQQQAILANEKMVDAMEKTFGQDASSGYSLTGSGVNSYAGKFTTAFASLVTNFEGGGIIPKTAKYVANGLSIYQSGSGAEVYGNISSSFIDVITEEGINAIFFGNPMTAPAKQLIKDIQAGKSVNTAIANFNRSMPDISNLAKAKNTLKNTERLSIFGDIVSLATSGYDFFSGLGDVIDNYNSREMNEQERQQLMDEIAGNSDTMACIKSTIDNRNKGTSYLRRQSTHTNLFSPFSTSLFISNIHLDCLAACMSRENNGFLQVDIFRLTGMKKQLEQLSGLLDAQVKNFFYEIIPPLIPWILGEWNKLKSLTINELLKRLKPAFASAVTNFKKIESINAYINENVAYVVMGNEINYTNASPDIISSLQKLGSGDLQQKFIQQSNDKIKNDMARVNMKFPPGSDWAIDFYTAEGKYVTNRSSYSKHAALYDLSPGNYNIALNHVLIPNVQLEKGKEFVFRFGFLNLLTRTSWHLYTESKKKQLTSGNKPKIMPLPVGSYVLHFEGKDYEIIIRDRMTLKFEPQVSEFLDK